jgi:hypothetical protein
MSTLDARDRPPREYRPKTCAIASFDADGNGDAVEHAALDDSRDALPER